MVLSNPFPGHTALTTFADLRRDLEGMVVRNAAGVMRAGVFPDHLNPLVTGRSDMKVNIGDFRAVQNRGGAVLLANVGTDTSVTLPAAPGANKRIDLIYVTMRSTALADAASTPIFGFVQGTASATPVAPSLPANLSTAIPLATVEIPAGATTTLSAGVVIMQVYPYSALAGGTVVVRNGVELAAWTPADGAKAYNISDKGSYERRNGGWGSGDIVPPSTVQTTGGSASIASDGSVTFTGSSTVSLNGVFAQGHDYIIEWDVAAVSDTPLSLRWRAGGSDASTSVYSGARMYQNLATGGWQSLTSESSIGLGPDNVQKFFGEMKVKNPAGASFTSSVQHSGIIASSGNAGRAGQIVGTHTHAVSAAHDGFTLLSTGAALSGIVYVRAVR